MVLQDAPSWQWPATSVSRAYHSGWQKWTNEKKTERANTHTHKYSTSHNNEIINEKETSQDLNEPRQRFQAISFAPINKPPTHEKPSFNRRLSHGFACGIILSLQRIKS